MTNTADINFDSLRAGLLTATTRDLARRRRRTRILVAPLTVIALFVATGLAAAANDDFADAVSDLPGGGIFDVFRTDGRAVVPTESSRAADEYFDVMGPAVQPDGTPRRPKNEKIVLSATVNGREVAILARRYEQKLATGIEDVTCWAVATDGKEDMATCSPEMMPGLPINYGSRLEATARGVRDITIHGITDDTVDRIEVVTFVGVEPAVMGDHAFYWASRPGHMPSYIRIHTKDGETVESSIGLPGRIDPKDL